MEEIGYGKSKRARSWKRRIRTRRAWANYASILLGEGKLHARFDEERLKTE
jgi:hypothetical protein